eukprot:1514046-Prymnesium_polylepis.2
MASGRAEASARRHKREQSSRDTLGRRACFFDSVGPRAPTALASRAARCQTSPRGSPRKSPPKRPYSLRASLSAVCGFSGFSTVEKP